MGTRVEAAVGGTVAARVVRRRGCGGCGWGNLKRRERVPQFLDARAGRGARVAAQRGRVLGHLLEVPDGYAARAREQREHHHANQRSPEGPLEPRKHPLAPERGDCRWKRRHLRVHLRARPGAAQPEGRAGAGLGFWGWGFVVRGARGRGAGCERRGAGSRGQGAVGVPARRRKGERPQSRRGGGRAAAPRPPWRAPPAPAPPAARASTQERRGSAVLPKAVESLILLNTSIHLRGAFRTDSTRGGEAAAAGRACSSATFSFPKRAKNARQSAVRSSGASGARATTCSASWKAPCAAGSAAHENTHCSSRRGSCARSMRCRRSTSSASARPWEAPHVLVL